MSTYEAQPVAGSARGQRGSEVGGAAAQLPSCGRLHVLGRSHLGPDANDTAPLVTRVAAGDQHSLCLGGMFLSQERKRH